MATLQELLTELDTCARSAALKFEIVLGSGDRVPVAVKGIDYTTNPTEAVTVELEFNRE